MLKGLDYALSPEQDRINRAYSNAAFLPCVAGLLAVRFGLRGNRAQAIIKQARVGLGG